MNTPSRPRLCSVTALAHHSLDAFKSPMAFEDEFDIDMSDKDAGTMDGFTTPSRSSSHT